MARSILTSLLIAVLIVLAAPAGADDIDIYIRPLEKQTSEPLVMFSIDVRPSTGQQGQFPSGSAPVNYFKNNLGTCAEFSGGCGTGTKTSIGDQFDYLRLSIKAALYDFQGKGVKVGLMISNDNSNNSGPSCNCQDGGTILYGFNDLAADGVARLAIDARLQAIYSVVSQNGSTGKHAYQFGEEMFELFRYLTGGAVYNGHNWDSAFALPAREDFTIENGAHTSYVSPLTTDTACAKAYVISFQSNQVNQDADSNTAISAAYNAGGVGLSGLGSNTDPASAITQAMNQLDLGNSQFPGMPNIDGNQNVTSYFFYSGSNAPEANSLAAAGGTGTATDYTAANYANNPDAIVKLIEKVFQQILDVSTTFVAASVPANVFNRAQSLDSVFIALFQPDDSAKPAWVGNVKKLRLKVLSGTTTLVDSADQTKSAINASTGRIDDDAITYWTDTTKLPLLAGRVRAGEAKPISPATTPVTDGRQVDRGGAGQRIPGVIGSTTELTGSPGGCNPSASGCGADNASTNRNLYYDPSTLSGTSPNFTGNLVALNADNPNANATTLQTALGASTVSDAANLIRYMRGQQTVCPFPTGAFTTVITTARNWIFGDPLHSRPLPINYGAATIGGNTYTSSNPAVFLFVTGNDGFLHVIQNINNDGTDNGKEVFGFVPQKVMGIEKSLCQNQPNSSPVHPYGMDGSATAYVQDNDGNGTIGSGDHVYLFIGLRRGGKAYYGFDVTDPTSPKLMWRIDDALPATINSPRGDFEEMGLAFSSPRVGYVKVSGTKKLALFFAGGYNTNKDLDGSPFVVGTTDPFTTANHAQAGNGGRAIYVADALTGALIWKGIYDATTTGPGSNAKIYTHTALTDSIPSDVTIADTDADAAHLVDRLLVGDTGGQVWRADFPDDDTTHWRLTRIANLGRNGDATSGRANAKVDDRRFFHAPALVPAHDSSGDYDAVLIGSGDREDPRDFAGLTTNWFYNIHDTNTSVLSASSTVTGFPRVQGDLADLTTDCFQTSTCSVSTPPDLSKGWRIQLNQGTSTTSEKALSSPLAFNGVVYFTTYLPPTLTSTNNNDDSSTHTTCQEPEGNGLLYAVKISDATAAFNYSITDGGSTDKNAASNSDADRHDDLKSGGIPSQVVYLPPITGAPAGTKPCILRPDLKCVSTNAPGLLPTFWQRVEKPP